MPLRSPRRWKTALKSPSCARWRVNRGVHLPTDVDEDGADQISSKVAEP